MQEAVQKSEDENSPQKRTKRFLQPEFIREWVSIWKQHGFREFVKRKGWKVVVGVFLFYLVRDSILYLILPYFAARGLLGC